MITVMGLPVWVFVAIVCAAVALAVVALALFFFSRRGEQ
jgi:anti-sigma-K factor RskA